jgi:hypothetical protein
VAALRSGLLGFDCSVCQDAPYIKEARGCEKPLSVPMILMEADEEWYNCPLQFVSVGVEEFVGKYNSYKAGLATPPDFDFQSAKFIEGVHFFDHWTKKYSEMTKNG